MIATTQLHITEKSRLITCILLRLSDMLFFDLAIPLDVTKLILSRYYYIYTNIDINGINRDELFEILWRTSRKINKPKYPNFWDAYNAKILLQKSPYSDEITYAETIAKVPLYVDIYQKGNIINVSKYNEITEEHTFEKIVEIYRKKKEKKEYSPYISLSRYDWLTQIERFLPLKNSQKVYIIDIGIYNKDVMAEGFVKKSTLYLTTIQIIETYSMDYEIGKEYELQSNKLAIIM
jgi:hypothetical protein